MSENKEVLPNQSSAFNIPDWTLLDFLKTFGIQTTTNFDLLEIAEYLGRGAKQSGLEIKVIMKDELSEELCADKETTDKETTDKETTDKETTDKELRLIINLNDKNQKGTHWVAFFADGSSKAFYFDSYGIKPLKEIEDQRNPLYPELVFNKEQVQHYETNICGQLCIYFLFKMSAAVDLSLDQRFKEIISELKDLYDQLAL